MAKKRCSICKELGHNALGCPERPADMPKPVKNEQQRRQSVINGRKGYPIEGVFDYFADLEDPPDDPLEASRWLGKIALRLTKLEMQGLGSKSVVERFCMLNNAYARIFPKDVTYEAQKHLEKDKLKRRPKKGTRKLDTPVSGGKGPLR